MARFEIVGVGYIRMGWGMIAPRHALSETELFLYTNELEAEVFGIDTATMPVDTTLKIPRANWWAVWCFDIIVTDPDHEELLVLFMNVDSGVSLLVPGRGDDFDGLIHDFEASFIDLLQENGAELEPTIDFKLTLMQGTEDDAQVADAFLEQLSEVAKASIRAGEDPAGLQATLHHTGLIPLEDEIPIERFRELLRARPFR